jgi:hypothetical protein
MEILALIGFYQILKWTGFLFDDTTIDDDRIISQRIVDLGYVDEIEITYLDENDNVKMETRLENLGY